MYTTEQFEKDVQGLRDLIRMCDELEKENDRKTNALIAVSYTHLTLPTSG